MAAMGALGFRWSSVASATATKLWQNPRALASAGGGSGGREGEYNTTTGEEEERGGA